MATHALWKHGNSEKGEATGVRANRQAFRGEVAHGAKEPWVGQQVHGREFACAEPLLWTGCRLSGHAQWFWSQTPSHSIPSPTAHSLCDLGHVS